MANSIVIAIVISCLGLLLLFLALLILYGLMYGMTSVLKEPVPGPQAPARQEQAAAAETTTIYQAVAIAVALARARQAPGPAGPEAGSDVAGTRAVSPWWTLHHGRQLTHTSPSRRPS